MDRIKELISKMTLEEKASLCSGADNWHTKEIKRLNIPSVMMVDGPHGLRKQEGETDHLGLNESVKAVCFPAACATASSFDVDLMEQMGETLGAECQAENVSMLLGPAVNIKRSPLCGRNFEYLSEDPYLAGRMASAYIRGVQSQGVGTSIKHFALNNQETLRMTISSEVSERALREIYLPAFEEAVKESAPRTVMCSYNKINGEYASENRYLLTDILRKEWGYKGCVVSDWGAVNNRVKGLQAGLDLEMPYSGGYNDRQIVKAVQEGRLDEAVLDEAVERVLNVVFAGEEQHCPEIISDKETDHKKAADIETECAVLLENNGILPLNTDRKVAYIGEFAEKPRYQGGGSSHINPFRVVSALDAAGEKGRSVTYAKGFSMENDAMTEQELEKALRTAAEADVAVIFAGLPEIFESGGQVAPVPQAQVKGHGQGRQQHGGGKVAVGQVQHAADVSLSQPGLAIGQQHRQGHAQAQGAENLRKPAVQVIGPLFRQVGAEQHIQHQHPHAQAQGIVQGQRLHGLLPGDHVAAPQQSGDGHQRQAQAAAADPQGHRPDGEVPQKG